MKKSLKWSIIAAIVIAAMLGCYTTVAFAVEDKFLFNTTINGVD